MTAKDKRSSAGRDRGRVLEELRAREALVVSMVSAVRYLPWRSPIGPSRSVPCLRRLSEVQLHRATQAFGTGSPEALRAVVLSSLAYEWAEVEGGIPDAEGRMWASPIETQVQILRAAMSQVSGLDVPLSMIRSDIADVEDDIATTLAISSDDDSLVEVLEAIEEARSLRDAGLPIVSAPDFSAWESGVTTVLEWVRDIRSLRVPLVDAQLALLEVGAAHAASDPILREEREELEAFVTEIRSSVPSSGPLIPLERLSADIFSRTRADSAFDSAAAFRELFVRASSSRMDASERIAFLSQVEHERVNLHVDSGELEAGRSIADRSLERLLQLRGSEDLDPAALDDLIRTAMRDRILVSAFEGHEEALVEAFGQFSTWLHIGPDLGGYGGSDREDLVGDVIAFVAGARDQFHGVPGFDELHEDVRSRYPDHEFWGDPNGGSTGVTS
jgi:hypothetical protein